VIRWDGRNGCREADSFSEEPQGNLQRLALLTPYFDDYVHNNKNNSTTNNSNNDLIIIRLSTSSLK
jgi:hypothetical protein